MSSRSTVAPKSAAAFAAAAQVARTPGLRTEELAPLLGWRVMHASKALTGAKHGGLIGLIRASGIVRWYPAEQMPQRLADAAEQRRQRKRRENEATARRLAEKRLQASPGLSDAPQVVRVHVGAPLPFTCRAPASVFHLGGML